MRVLFATSELRPLASAGGLGEAAAGLTAALAQRGVDITTALPDYERWKLEDEESIELAVPEWAGPASARLGEHPDAGRLALIDIPGIERADPYVDENGNPWPDNDFRFAAFSAAVASLARHLDSDVVHLNDWHTSFVPAFVDDGIATILTIHNLAFQGWVDPTWLHRLPRHRELYRWGDGVGALAGAIATADLVTTVSPTYAGEIVHEVGGMGLNGRLAERGDDLVGVLNGIDTRSWNPETDPHAPQFSINDLAGKDKARAKLLDRVGWEDNGEPLIVIVSRLFDQKGMDLAFECARFLEGMRARMIVLGSGERHLADRAAALAVEDPERFWFYEGFDVPLSHLLFAGGDLLMMPSRFEPCGLAQMQSMAYGTIPIVTPVGGLADTVIDDDEQKDGNGFVAAGLDPAAVVDATHRALRAMRHSGRKNALRKRGMGTDWSWTEPAARFVELYERAASKR